VKGRIGAVVALAGLALVAAAQSPAQPQTTAPPPVVTVKVTLSDTAIRVSPRRAQRGTFGRFILLNTGSKTHGFALGAGGRHGVGKQTGFTKTLKAGQQTILLLFLDYRGVIPYAGTLPADRTKPRMKGTFTIF
jgi:hypothetical protein